MRRALIAVAVMAVMATGCVAMGPSASTPGSFARVGQRQVSVTLSGPSSYSVSNRPATSGSISVTYTNSNTVDSISGTMTYPGAVSGTATITVNLSAFLSSFNGSVTVSDPSAGVNVTVPHSNVAAGIDGDGDASATATDAASGYTITWSFSTVAYAVTDSRYQALTDLEANLCQDQQQRLGGLNPTEVPLSSITNVDDNSRLAFAQSKASLTPLTTHSFRQSGQVDTAGGENVVITRSFSCKNRAADHVATLGVSTAPFDLQCKVQNQHHLDLALAQLSPGEALAYSSSGRPLVLADDIVVQTGTDWLQPFPDVQRVGGSTVVTAKALLTRWTDPTFAIFPDTIRGVHYCTGMSPAWFFWYLTKGAFLP